jgi:hypothetical protein
MLLPDVWPKTLKYIQTYTNIPDYMHMYIYLYPSETEYACIYFHTHTYTASESMYLFPHTYVHSLGIPPRQKTYMYACTHTYMQNRIPPKPEKPALKGRGHGQGQGVVEIRARLRDSSAKRGSNTGPFCGVSRAASTGHSGQIPRGGRTGRLELRARLRGRSRSNGARTHARCFPQAGFERTRVECVVGSDPPQALFTGPASEKVGHERVEHPTFV